MSQAIQPVPHLLLLPGLACDAEVWKHQASAFSDFTSVQIAEYGASDSLEEMAHVVLRGAPERFALAGHSMGGRVAFEILRRAPGRVAGLAVLDTGYKPLEAGAAGERERSERLAFVELAQTQGMRAMARQWVRNMVHPDRLADAALIEAIVGMLGRKSSEIFRAQIEALLHRPDATAVLGEIRCPTLVLCGREDAWSLLSRHQEIAARIPGSRLAVIEHCGHMATMEQPEAVTAALREWMLDVTASRKSF